MNWGKFWATFSVICGMIALFGTLVLVSGNTLKPPTEVIVGHPPAPIENAIIIDKNPEPNIHGLPEGWRIVRNTSNGSYRWVDDNGFMSVFDESTYEKALAAAIRRMVYVEREKNSKWIDVDEINH